MRIRSTFAMAAALALSQLGAAYAETPEVQAQFRAVEPRTFSTEELQRYGLDANEATRAVELQAQGYQILALTPEEAEAYRAGAISQTEWILIGVGVLIILAIA